PLSPSFFSTVSAHSALSTLSLHDALPISLFYAFPTGYFISCHDNYYFLDADLPAFLRSCSPANLIPFPLYGSGARSDRILAATRSEEHTSELQSRENLVCRLLLEKKKKTT